jgi:hypothetical protein
MRMANGEVTTWYASSALPAGAGAALGRDKDRASIARQRSAVGGGSHDFGRGTEPLVPSDPSPAATHACLSRPLVRTISYKPCWMARRSLGLARALWPGGARFLSSTAEGSRSLGRSSSPDCCAVLCGCRHRHTRCGWPDGQSLLS